MYIKVFFFTSDNSVIKYILADKIYYSNPLNPGLVLIRTIMENFEDTFCMYFKI